MDINKRRSEKMKQNFIDGKIKGWVINGDKNRRSYPEKFFIKVFENNKLYERFTIEEKFPYGRYFIDFLFVELKVVFEVDGEQHFKNEDSIKHDKIRDDFFIKNGFRVYRVRWKDVCNNTEDEIKEFLNFLDSSLDSRKYTIDDVKYEKKKQIYKPRKKNKKCLNCESLINKRNSMCRSCYLESREKSERVGKNRCENCNESIFGEKLCKKCYNLSQRKVSRPNKEQLRKEVESFGFCEVGRRYGVSDNTIRKWLK